MKRKRIITVGLALIMFFFNAIGGHNWERTNYRNSTIISGIVTIDGKAASVGDFIGAFVGNECRMIAPIFMNNDSSYISSVIHGEIQETVSFKIWIKSEDKIYSLKDTITSNPGGGFYLHKLDFKR